ncbi:hypothetical protein [Chryseobacterium sp. HR92]|uniref:hypothetical protein n=1 Tax=Chryseobacterium sp. HR92 TaxID=3094839 RepID=UPI003890F762|nr:hypothetical protein SFA27_03430 [Chryseobacterium sp. HR92]
MKKIRKISTNPLFILLLLTNYILYSCSSESNDLENNENSSVNKSSVNSNKLQNFTDEEVFKGVIFMEGDVAELFPEYKELNFRNFIDDQDDINEIVNFQNVLMNSIKDENPEFLSNFNEEITSGDYDRVKEAISLANTEIKKQLFKIYNLTESQFVEFQDAFAKGYSQVDKPTKITKEYLAELINSIKQNSSTDNLNNSTDNMEGKINVVYTDMALVLYGVVAVVVMAVAVGFIHSVALAESGKTSENNFYYENFYADITLKLKGK